MKYLAALIIMLALAVPASAVDLATGFGIAGLPVSLLSGSDPCHFQAVHGGATTLQSVTITANGSDSATISLICNGASVVATLPSISVNGHQVSNVAFPQTVTSSGAGVWIMVVMGLVTFTVVAQ